MYEIWLPEMASAQKLLLGYNLCRHRLLTVKGKGQQAHPALHAKYLVDNHVLWSNPANPGEIAKGGKYQVRKPVPHEASGKGVQKEVVARRLPFIGVPAEPTTRSAMLAVTLSMLLLFTYPDVFRLSPLPCRAALRAVFPNTPGHINSGGSTTTLRARPANTKPNKMVASVIDNSNPQPAFRP